MVVPIMILVNNPGSELLTLLDNVEKTNKNGNPIIIVDDQSSDETSKDLLYHNNIVELDGEKMLSLKGKYNIIQTSKFLGKKYRVLFAVNSAFKIFDNAETCVIIDGASELKEGWLEEMLTMYARSKHVMNISMISSYNSNTEENENVNSLVNAQIEGKVTLFTRKFYTELKKIGYFSTADLKGIGTAYSLIQKISLNIGFNTIKSNKSFI